MARSWHDHGLTPPRATVSFDVVATSPSSPSSLRTVARSQRRRVAARVGVCAFALVVSGCLSATPPKTPNQRAAERAAPHVIVPPPPDAGRTPRPAHLP
ncbi:MAG: hypothetical protein ABIR79_25500 [Candidatus Binatia bacterium]